MNPAGTASQTKGGLLQGWHTGLRIVQIGNFDAAAYYSKLGKRFGIPVVIATSIVSSVIFATLGDSSRMDIQLASGFISILATILASLQTFLGYPERSSSHKEAAAGYGDLRTEVQVLLTTDLSLDAELDERIESIRSRWVALDKASPALPAWIYDKAAATVRTGGRDRDADAMPAAGPLIEADDVAAGRARSR